MIERFDGVRDAMNDNQKPFRVGERCEGHSSQMKYELFQSLGAPPYVVANIEEQNGTLGIVERFVTCVAQKDYVEGMRVQPRVSVARGSKSFVKYMKVKELSLVPYEEKRSV